MPHPTSINVDKLKRDIDNLSKQFQAADSGVNLPSPLADQPLIIDESTDKDESAKSDLISDAREFPNLDRALAQATGTVGSPAEEIPIRNAILALTSGLYDAGDAVANFLSQTSEDEDDDYPELEEEENEDEGVAASSTLAAR